VRGEMLAQAVDAFGQECNLNFGRAGVVARCAGIYRPTPPFSSRVSGMKSNLNHNLDPLRGAHCTRRGCCSQARFIGAEISRSGTTFPRVRPPPKRGNRPPPRRCAHFRAFDRDGEWLALPQCLHPFRRKIQPPPVDERGIHRQQYLGTLDGGSASSDSKSLALRAEWCDAETFEKGQVTDGLETRSQISASTRM